MSIATLQKFPPKKQPRILMNSRADRRESAMIRGKCFSFAVLRFRFFFHRDLDLAGHVAMQADRHFKLAQAFE